jgi:hypothetical protein
MKMIEHSKGDDLKSLRKHLVEEGGGIIRRLKEFKKLIGS